MSEKALFKFGEDKFLEEVLEHIKSTYSGSYVGNGKVQTVELWDGKGSAVTTCRDIVIKYMQRYGYKAGRNKTDLFKAIHNIIFMYYFGEKNDWMPEDIVISGMIERLDKLQKENEELKEKLEFLVPTSSIKYDVPQIFVSSVKKENSPL